MQKRITMTRQIAWAASTDAGNAASEFCRHGVPSFAPCRWCQDGTEPQETASQSESERQRRVDAIRTEWQAKFERGTKS